MTNISTALLADALAQLGLTLQGAETVLPMRGFEDARFFGPAVTAKFGPRDEVDPDAPPSIFDLAEGMPQDAVVCIQGVDGYVFTGGTQARALQTAGAGAFVISGGVRDLADFRELELPLWARHPATRLHRSAYALTGVNVPISIGNVPVEPGDWIAADEDGVVVVPARRREEAERIAGELDAMEQEMFAMAVEPGRITELKQMYGKKSKIGVPAQP